MKSRLILAALAVSLVSVVAVFNTSPATGVAGFGDVADERFYTEPVQWMVDNNITTGTSPTCFSPDDPVTRGQAAAFLWRIAGSPTGFSPHRFVDVYKDWQQLPVSWMAAEGITTGTSATTYSPQSTLTRGQMAALLHRAAGEPAAPTTTFPDVVSDWQLIPVGWLEAEDITTGTSQTTFSPSGTVTRAQFVAFAYRWRGSPPVVVDPASPNCSADGLPAPSDEVSRIDWWGCWRAEEALDGSGSTPSNGERVALLRNCASGPRSVGTDGDMTHASDPPVFRTSGADGHPSIEFTFFGNTLLQTNGGSAWTGSDRLDSGSTGVTLAWIGMTTDIDPHPFKYIVSGLSRSDWYPQIRIEGEGANRFEGWAGAGDELRSSAGTITDNRVHGVIIHFDPDGRNSSIEVDGSDFNTGPNSRITADIAGLTLGNFYNRGFSTTDHQFVFLGLHEGELSAADRNAFWAYLSLVRSG